MNDKVKITVESEGGKTYHFWLPQDKVDIWHKTIGTLADKCNAVCGGSPEVTVTLDDGSVSELGNLTMENNPVFLKKLMDHLEINQIKSFKPSRETQPLHIPLGRGFISGRKGPRPRR